MVVLNEVHVQTFGLLEITLVEALKEETRVITKNLGLQNQKLLAERLALLCRAWLD